MGRPYCMLYLQDLVVISGHTDVVTARRHFPLGLCARTTYAFTRRCTSVSSVPSHSLLHTSWRGTWDGTVPKQRSDVRCVGENSPGKPRWWNTNVSGRRKHRFCVLSAWNSSGIPALWRLVSAPCRGKKVKVSIVSIALSQLCDLRASAHLHLHGSELAVSCRHSSVMWVVGHAHPLPHTAVTFLAFSPIPNYTYWWPRHMCLNSK